MSSIFNSYVKAHLIYLPSQVSAVLLAAATIEMAICTIANLGKTLSGSEDPVAKAKNQKDLGINFCSVLTWGILASNYVPFFAVAGLAAFVGWSTLCVDKDDKDSYLSMRLCNRLFASISPYVAKICRAVGSLFKGLFNAFNHPIGYALVVVLGAVTLYHGPVVLLNIPSIIIPYWIGY